MNESYKNIFRNFLKYVQGVADKEYQMRIWVQALGPECDDFSETANYILADGDLILRKYNDFNLTEKQRSLLTTFLKEFDQFAYTIACEHPEGDFIDSPEWTHVTEMAKEVLQAFHWKPTTNK
jgi:hypothetical protein